jgi:altronate hydrolase
MSVAVHLPVIRLSPEDGVLIARIGLPPGTAVADGVQVCSRRIPPGHKVAVRAHAVGDAIRRYGQVIGFATEAIAPGDWVHTHNFAMGDFAKDYAWGADAKPPHQIAVRVRRLGARQRREGEGGKARVGERGHDELGTGKWIEGGGHVGPPLWLSAEPEPCRAAI